MDFGRHGRRSRSVLLLVRARPPPFLVRLPCSSGSNARGRPSPGQVPDRPALRSPRTRWASTSCSASVARSAPRRRARPATPRTSAPAWASQATSASARSQRRPGNARGERLGVGLLVRALQGVRSIHGSSSVRASERAAQGQLEYSGIRDRALGGGAAPPVGGRPRPTARLDVGAAASAPADPRSAQPAAPPLVDLPEHRRAPQPGCPGPSRPGLPLSRGGDAERLAHARVLLARR